MPELTFVSYTTSWDTTPASSARPPLDHLEPARKAIRRDVHIAVHSPEHTRSIACSAAVRQEGVGKALTLFLPPHSPDLNPIEMAFVKLKTLIRRAAARTYDKLWQAVGHVCNLFTDEECLNSFKAEGYEPD